MSKFREGFSLVELLVVIAIIGILAAVGITAYQGYTTGAKEKATAAQHGQVIALLNAEMAKCAGGAGDDIFGIACNSDRTHASIVTYFNDTLDMNNPYSTDTAAVVANASLAGAGGVPGTIAVFCESGNCSVITKGSGVETLSETVNAY
tara:strand:+ start:247 stop:693 length:447 start_codon:yes stop_codon:yes gene_type:complete